MKTSNSSYKQIIKSTGIYGSSQLVNIVLGVIRSKLTAIFLGTTGIGLLGLFQSVIDLTRSVSSLGIETGATKSIASMSEDNTDVLGEKVYSISIWFLGTAFLGALLCIFFCYPLSLWAFGNCYYALHIALLSIVVFLVTLTTGLTAIMQGLRKIPYMALASSTGSFVSLIAMIPIYYIWGIKGIIPTLVITNLLTFIVAFYFYKKIKIKPVKIPTKEILVSNKGMLELGLYIVLAGIFSTASLFAVRSYINQEEGINTVGLFQAVWVITTILWGLILRSANTDFFPKLCSIISDGKATRRFVNEQTYIILLIVSPVVIGLVVFSDFIMSFLYTSEFVSASATLRWHLVAVFFKIASTPVATIMLAKNRGGLHLICEVVFWLTYLFACYFLYPIVGLKGTGMAYLIAYVVYMPTVLFVSYRMCHMAWNWGIVKMILVNVFLIAFLYFAVHFYYANLLVLGSVIFLVALSYSFFKLKEIVNISDIVHWLKRRV